MKRERERRVSVAGMAAKVAVLGDSARAAAGVPARLPVLGPGHGGGYGAAPAQRRGTGPGKAVRHRASSDATTRGPYSNVRRRQIAGRSRASSAGRSQHAFVAARHVVGVGVGGSGGVGGGSGGGAYTAPGSAVDTAARLRHLTMQQRQQHQRNQGMAPGAFAGVQPQAFAVQGARGA